MYNPKVTLRTLILLTFSIASTLASPPSIDSSEFSLPAVKAGFAPVWFGLRTIRVIMRPYGFGQRSDAYLAAYMRQELNLLLAYLHGRNIPVVSMYFNYEWALVREKKKELYVPAISVRGYKSQENQLTYDQWDSAAKTIFEYYCTREPVQITINIEGEGQVKTTFPQYGRSDRLLRVSQPAIGAGFLENQGGFGKTVTEVDPLAPNRPELNDNQAVVYCDSQTIRIIIPQTFEHGGEGMAVYMNQEIGMLRFHLMTRGVHSFWGDFVPHFAMVTINNIDAQVGAISILAYHDTPHDDKFWESLAGLIVTYYRTREEVTMEMEVDAMTTLVTHRRYTQTPELEVVTEPAFTGGAMTGQGPMQHERLRQRPPPMKAGWPTLDSHIAPVYFDGTNFRIVFPRQFTNDDLHSYMQEEIRLLQRFLVESHQNIGQWSFTYNWVHARVRETNKYAGALTLQAYAQPTSDWRPVAEIIALFYWGRRNQKYMLQMKQQLVEITFKRYTGLNTYIMVDNALAVGEVSDQV